MNRFPVSLNLTGKLAVVIGGGAVGMRKLSALLESGAAVRLVDPHQLPQLPSEVAHVSDAYRPEHLTGAALVFACATPEVNARVVADARIQGKWVSSASAPAEGDFELPAVVRCGDLTLAIGTGGAAPALARRIREKLEAEFDRAFAEWVRILADVRGDVLATVADAATRHALLDGFADWHWLARVRAEGADAVLAAMRAMIP